MWVIIVYYLCLYLYAIYKHFVRRLMFIREMYCTRTPMYLLRIWIPTLSPYLYLYIYWPKVPRIYQVAYIVTMVTSLTKTGKNCQIKVVCSKTSLLFIFTEIELTVCTSKNVHRKYSWSSSHQLDEIEWSSHMFTKNWIGFCKIGLDFAVLFSAGPQHDMSMGFKASIRRRLSSKAPWHFFTLGA